jgi:hypothetical protein
LGELPIPRVADHGTVLDASGNVVKDYAGLGLPAFLEFDLPVGADAFLLEVNGARIRQELPDPRVRPAPAPIPKITTTRRPEPEPSERRGCLLLIVPLLTAIWRRLMGS